MFARFATEQHLLDAWEHIRRREEQRRDQPRRAIHEFERDAAANVAQLVSALRQGSWRPDPVQMVQIPKRRGGTRELGIPSVRDQIVERALVDILDGPVDARLLPTSFAYRRGLGVDDAIAALCAARDDGAAFVLRADLADCFPSIPRRAVLDLLRRVVDEERLVDVVRLLVYRVRRHEQSTGARGLHQGGPLSPLLCNLYLDQLDRASLAGGLATIRYADDLAVPLLTKADAQHAMSIIHQSAGRIGLTVNESKSRVQSFEEGVHYLGEVVTENTRDATEDRRRPRKATVFVCESGALLRSRGGRLRVQVGGDDRLNLNFDRVRQIICHGRVGMTTPLLHQVLDRGIDVVLLSDSGRYIGRIASTGHVRSGIRRNQYRRADDRQFCLDLARRIVVAKLTNLRTGVVRWSRAEHLREARAAIETIEATRDRVANAADIPTAMGHEGAATAAYFRHLGLLVGDEWGFAERTRRPPRDPISAMLSFGYALLTTELIAACEIAGLDPYVGFLHAEYRGRPSLALDLIEEFRPVIVDSIVFRLVRTKAISPEDFRRPDDGAVLLTDDARKRYFAAYERRMLSQFTHVPSGRKVSYRIALSLQAGQLAETLQRGVPYTSVAWK